MHIQDRTEQKLKGDSRAAGIARDAAQHGGQGAAGAVARHAQPRRVNAEQLGIARHMVQRGDGVGQAVGKGMVGASR